MLTRSLSQRVLTLSLPKVNRRKRLEMRYFCVLTRRCGSRPRPEMKNPARRNSRRVALGPQQTTSPTGGRAARKKTPPPAWVYRPRGRVGRRIAQLSFAPIPGGGIAPRDGPRPCVGRKYCARANEYAVLLERCSTPCRHGAPAPGVLWYR